MFSYLKLAGNRHYHQYWNGCVLLFFYCIKVDKALICPDWKTRASSKALGNVAIHFAHQIDDLIWFVAFIFTIPLLTMDCNPHFFMVHTRGYRDIGHLIKVTFARHESSSLGDSWDSTGSSLRLTWLRVQFDDCSTYFLETTASYVGFFPNICHQPIMWFVRLSGGLAWWVWGMFSYLASSSPIIKAERRLQNIAVFVMHMHSH